MSDFGYVTHHPAFVALLSNTGAEPWAGYLSHLRTFDTNARWVVMISFNDLPFVLVGGGTPEEALLQARHVLEHHDAKKGCRTNWDVCRDAIGRDASAWDFMAWIRDQATEFRREHGINFEHEIDSAAFDAWLRREAPAGGCDNEAG